MLESLTAPCRPTPRGLGPLGGIFVFPEVGLAVDSALGALLGSETGHILLLTAPERAAARLALPRPLADRPRLALTTELLARLPDAEALAEREHEAAAGRGEPGGRLRLETARAETRAALAQAYERLVADYAALDDLVVCELELALAEQLDLSPLAVDRRRLVWVVPGRLRAGRARLYQGLTPPACLAVASVGEWRDGSE